MDFCSLKIRDKHMQQHKYINKKKLTIIIIIIILITTIIIKTK